MIEEVAREEVLLKIATGGDKTAISDAHLPMSAEPPLHTHKTTL